MMAASLHEARLIERLPPVRGRLLEAAPLSRITWFKVGGPAEAEFTPADADDLAAFLAATPGDVPVTVIGVGSNLLVRDGGVPGVVVRLGREFSGISPQQGAVRADAGALDINVARAARDSGLKGLEFMAGIPGTVGGALRMNAGAYGAEIKDVFIEARAVGRDGRLHRLDPANMGFAYRQTSVPADWIFIDALFAAKPGARDEIAARMAEITDARSESQPVRQRTGGSTFANPPGGAKAWQLIDQAGCRGLMIGGAQVSDKHCNFLINTGHATAADIEALGEEVRRRVLETSGIHLQWEIRIIGVAAEPGPRPRRMVS